MTAQTAIEHQADGASASALAQVLVLIDPVLARKGRPAASADQDLREAGLSSLDTVNLMLAVEGAFDLFIPEAEMTPENFRSARAIAGLVERLR
jgi:acyl carrier protein